MITPWTTRWVVLTPSKIMHYKEDKKTLKGEMKIDETARVIIAVNESSSNYRFAIMTSTDGLEFGVSSIDERNMWIQKLVYLAEGKSVLGSLVMRVDCDADYRTTYKWESLVVAHSIESSSGLTMLDGESNKKPKLKPARKDVHFASFVPFDEWQDIFEPDVRVAKEQAMKDEELRKQGGKVPESSSMVRLRDYMVESLVTNITAVSTTKSCNLLLEGMCQLIAASERQLARTYQQCLSGATPKTKDITCSSIPATNTAEAGDGDGKFAQKIQNNDDAANKVEEIPLEVQEDLLCTLGSLRALILSYRFYDATRDAQMQFTRRLAVHQLVRSLSRVMKSLEDIQDEVEAAAVELSGAEGLSHAATTSKETEDEKAKRKRKASLIQLRAIMRPLLSREFLQLEAAPLLQDFMNRNNTSIKQFEGLAAEVKETFGNVVQSFVEKKITDMEDAVIDQMDKFVNVISEYSDNSVDPTILTPAAGDASALPSSSREVMVRLAQEKANVEKKIAQIKIEGSVLWDGTDKSLVEMVLLEQTDALWKQLQDSVSMCIEGGLYALLDMAGGGLSPAAAQAHEAEHSHSAAPAPAPAPAKPSSSGFFF